MLSITAVADPATGRVRIEVSGWTGETSVSCRAPTARTLTPAYLVRGADPLPPGAPDPVVVYDYEAPLNTPLTYTVSDDVGTASAGGVFLAADRSWLVHPNLPYLSRLVTVESQTESEWQGMSTEFDVQGAAYPLVMTAVRNSRSGSLNLIVPVGTPRFDLMRLFSDGSLLLLRSPCPAVDDARWMNVRSVREEPVGDGSEWRRWVLDYRLAARPPGGVILDPAWVYDAVPPLYATYAELGAAFGTYFDLRTYIPALGAPIVRRGQGAVFGW